MIQLSVVVITYNEAANIERCLQSVADVADDTLVVDSFSTDDTVALARGAGARVIQHPFESYAAQRERATRAALHNYVLALDADEWLTPELAAAIQRTKQQWTHDAYTFNRRSQIADYWMSYTSWYPDRKLRLFDRRCIAFSVIRGHDGISALPGATVQHLPGDLLHATNANIHERVSQINNLSSVAARHLHSQGQRGSLLRLWLKPTGRFIVEYFLRLGLLDGFYGYVISRTSAQYVFMREAKLLEISRSATATNKEGR